MGSPRVAVHHAIPAEVLHRDHGILINNRLVVKSTGNSSLKNSTSTSTAKSSSTVHKTVFYHPEEGNVTIELTVR